MQDSAKSNRTLFELDLLRALVMVADCGSFTTAATRLHSTQSTVSQKVRRLEELAGHRLLERGHRGAGSEPRQVALADHAGLAVGQAGDHRRPGDVHAAEHVLALAEDAAPLLADARTFDELSAYRYRLEQRVAERTAELEVSLRQNADLLEELKRKSVLLEKLSREDDLTALANRRCFDESLGIMGSRRNLFFRRTVVPSREFLEWLSKPCWLNMVLLHCLMLQWYP